MKTPNIRIIPKLEVKGLNDIDISGFEVKSKPMLYLNWLKSKNPLRGEKE